MYSASRVPTTHLDTCRVDPLTNCYGATGGRVLKLMGHSQGRDNVKKRKARRKKTERLALAKSKQKPAK